jgi:acetyl-CoA decarbonylase/synthase complex subunit gamma
VVIPVELVTGAKPAILIAAALALLAGLGPNGYSTEGIIGDGLRAAGMFLGLFAAGVVLAPILLPWLPGRAFSVKGAFLGIVISAGIGLYAACRPGALGSWFAVAGWLVAAPAVASFLALNFTGASTYTSLSGVKLETKWALPVQGVLAAAAAGLWIAGRFA